MLKNSIKGFSLLELMIVSVILTIILGTVLFLLITSSNFFDTTTIDVDLANKAKITAEWVTKELNRTYRNAMTITDGSNYVITYTAVIDFDSNQNKVVYDNAARNFTWDKTARTLSHTAGGSTRVIANDVAYFNIQFLSNTNDTRHLIFLTLSKPLQTSGGVVQTVTQQLREEIYMLKDKSK